MSIETHAHSWLGGSVVKRVKLCPGSVRQCKGIPPSSSHFADEGTEAHAIGADFIKHGTVPKDVDPEMLEAVMVYAKWVINKIKEHKDTKVLVEKKFDLSSVYPGLFGSADCVIYNPLTKVLTVIDYKHGAGVPVYVKNNLQLLFYALGALISTGFPCESVEMCIVQPRCPHEDGPIRTWSVDAIDILDYAADLREIAVRAQDPNAPLNPGDEQCRFCPAKGTCPALHELALTHSRQEFLPTLSYDPVKLSDTLTKLPAIEAWVKGVREFAYREAEHGRCPPGWKLVPKRATRQWSNEEEAVALASSRPELFETSLKSIAQSEKVLGKKVFEEKFGHLVSFVSSGLTLAPDSDKRPAALADAKSEFEIIKR